MQHPLQALAWPWGGGGPRQSRRNQEGTCPGRAKGCNKGLIGGGGGGGATTVWHGWVAPRIVPFAPKSTVCPRRRFDEVKLGMAKFGTTKVCQIVRWCFDFIVRNNSKHPEAKKEKPRFPQKPQFGTTASLVHSVQYIFCPPTPPRTRTLSN